MNRINAYIQIATLVTILLISSAANSDRSSNNIYWSERQKLTWNDFEGKPRKDLKAISALTSSGIVHYTGCHNGVMTYKVLAYFEKDHSWVKREAYTDYHLHHEQIHFDITELYARKLRKLLSENAFYCGQEEAFEEFVNVFLTNWQTTQKIYDFNTNHSMDKNQQMEWQHRINLELSLLEDFKDTSREVSQ